MYNCCVEAVVGKKMCATDFKHFLIGSNINKIRIYGVEREWKSQLERKNVRAILFGFGKKEENKINTPTRHVQAIDGNNSCNCIKHKWQFWIAHRCNGLSSEQWLTHSRAMQQEPIANGALFTLNGKAANRNYLYFSNHRACWPALFFSIDHILVL